MKFNFLVKSFYLLIAILIVSCSFDSLIDSSDYRIFISDQFGTSDGFLFEYGYTLENQGIVAATQLEISIRFSFSDGVRTSSISVIDRFTENLDVGESAGISGTFSSSEAPGGFDINDLTGVRITSIRFFNIEESADLLSENTYQGNEGIIPIR